MSAFCSLIQTQPNHLPIKTRPDHAWFLIRPVCSGGGRTPGLPRRLQHGRRSPLQLRLAWFHSSLRQWRQWLDTAHGIFLEVSRSSCLPPAPCWSPSQEITHVSNSVEPTYLPHAPVDLHRAFSPTVLRCLHYGASGQNVADLVCLVHWWQALHTLEGLIKYYKPLLYMHREGKRYINLTKH
jgi:hypothetical protein